MRERVGTIRPQELQGYNEALAAIGSRPGNNRPKSELTIRFIEETLEQQGFRIMEGSREQSGGPLAACNVVAEVRGTVQPDSVIEVGAHYDTVPFCPGADDNGSGVAGALAIARVLSEEGTGKTVRIVFYALEESGGLGGRTHVERILASEGERFEGVVVLEMIGYSVQEPETQKTPVRIPFLVWPPRTGNFIATVGRGDSAFIGRHFEQAATDYAPGLRVYSMKRLGGFLGDGGRSDHASYWAADLPGLMLTDTANFRNPHYHAPTDTLGTLNLEFQTEVTRATAAALLKWAGPADKRGDLTCQREWFQRKAGPVPLEDASVGMAVGGLSRAEACREIVRRLWEAAIRKDRGTSGQLWSSFPDGDPPAFAEGFVVTELAQVGEPYTQAGCHFGTPTFITPAELRLADGRTVTSKLIVVFRDVGMEESCVIVGVWGG